MNPCMLELFMGEIASLRQQLGVAHAENALLRARIELLDSRVCHYQLPDLPSLLRPQAE